MLQKAYDDRSVQTIGVVAGPAIAGAANVHSAMEEWMTHAVRVYLERFPCLKCCCSATATAPSPPT